MGKLLPTGGAGEAGVGGNCLVSLCAIELLQ